MEFLDARRLTGPNVCCDGPGSILDIACEAAEVDRIQSRWQTCIETAAAVMGWDVQTHALAVEGGVSLVFEAPIDALYAASAVNEWAYACIEAEMSGNPLPDFASARDGVDEALADEVNPALLQLKEAAESRSVTFLWDDDNASLGMGQHSRTWTVNELPLTDALDWDQFQDIPVGMITGTNGKTTCTRIASRILREAGHRVGVSCTDWLAADDEIIDRGDWSGPGGARTILREPRVSAAILETARGGLLRRGLGINQANASLITNIAEDHLGDFGSGNLDELLNIKWIVSRAVRETGMLVLNADDQRLVARASDYPGQVSWFSLLPSSEVVEAALARGETVFTLEQGELICKDNQGQTRFCEINQIPITLNGAARHNIANCLAAAALTHAMGVELSTIGRALIKVTQTDNPGRSNIYEIDGVRVLVDFAHNPHAMAALFELASQLPAKRRLLAFGQAGDRPDHSIRELSQAAWSIGLDCVSISELPHYYRGREHMEVYHIIRDELLKAGAVNEQIRHFEEETAALRDALDWAQPGDLIIMLALGEREAIRELLDQASADSSSS